MKSILKATELILKTYLREPMILLWNLAFPFFVFYVSTGKNLLNKDVGESLYFILPYLAWCVYSNSMGAIHHLLWWRDSGLIRSVAGSKKRYLQFFISLILSNAILNFIFSFVFILGLSFIYGKEILFYSLRVCPLAFLFSILFTSAMHILTTLKMRVSTLQQITIILGVAFIMSMSIFNESLYPIEKIAWENAVPTFLTYINPIGWFSRAFSLTLFQGGQMRWLMEGFILIFFILISFYSFKRIRFKPVGKR